MEVIPFMSVGPLRFGDSRALSRNKLGSRFCTFRKGPFAKNETDSFDDLGLHLYYTDEDTLEFVEGFHPAVITFQGIAFLGRRVESIISDMNSLGFSLAESDVGVDFPEAGIALTAPSGIVEGVAAHRKGYYD